MSNVLKFVCPFCGKEGGLYTNICGGASACNHGPHHEWINGELQAKYIKIETTEKIVKPIGEV